MMRGKSIAAVSHAVADNARFFQTAHYVIVGIFHLPLQCCQPCGTVAHGLSVRCGVVVQSAQFLAFDKNFVADSVYAFGVFLTSVRLCSWPDDRGKSRVRDGFVPF